jgi:heme-degrading monooxygenase HmoA
LKVLKRKEVIVYARIITSQLKPGMLEQATSIWRESIVPSLKNTKGFRGGYMNSDPHTGKGTVVTLWETEADASAMNSSGQYQQSIAQFASLLVSTPDLEQIEVMVQV